jgi:hypothetical protein
MLLDIEKTIQTISTLMGETTANEVIDFNTTKRNASAINDIWKTRFIKEYSYYTSHSPKKVVKTLDSIMQRIKRI